MDIKIQLIIAEFDRNQMKINTDNIRKINKLIINL